MTDNRTYDVYYLGVPTIDERVKSLEEQLRVLTNSFHQLSDAVFFNPFQEEPRHPPKYWVHKIMYEQLIKDTSK